MPATVVSGPVEFSLRLIGVWPESSCRIFQRVAWTTSMAVFQTFQYRYIVAHVASGDLPDLLDCLSLSMSNSLLLLKLFALWISSGVFRDTLTMMSEDWSRCSSAECNARVMADKASLSRRFSVSIIGLYSFSVCAYGTSALLTDDDADAAPSSGRRYFLKMEFPFDSGQSPVYELVMAVQFVQQFAAASMAGMFNALIVTLILHVGGQIDIMCDGLAEITSEGFDRGSTVRALRSVIGKHQRIISFSDNVETVFTYIALMQFLSNTAVVCFLGFVIVTSFDSEDGSRVLMKVLPYCTVVNLEAFVLCYAGEYLSSKGDAIFRCAYESSWYELRPSESKILLLLILRSQRRLTITAGKFMDLSLESFTKIVKASASYVSVLYAMY